MVKLKHHSINLIEGKKLYFGRKKLNFKDIKEWENYRFQSNQN